jgi:hypothetical protein
MSCNCSHGKMTALRCDPIAHAEGSLAETGTKTLIWRKRWRDETAASPRTCVGDPHE